MVSGAPSPSPSRSDTSSPAIADGASGYLLLSIPHAVVKQVYQEQTMILARGELRLECISLPIPPAIGKQTANPFAPSPHDPTVPTHDFWLVVKVGPTFEKPLIPGQHLQPQDPISNSSSNGTSAGTTGIPYLVDSTSVAGASLLFVLPSPNTQADLEDLESFEVLLRQYGCLESEATALGDVSVPPFEEQAPLPQDMRGRLVLVNDDNGEVIGELDQELDVQEGEALARDPKGKPVVLDFGNVVDGYSPSVKVQTVPEDELDDWMLKGAHNISKGILGFSSWSTRMIAGSADKFVKNTKPTDKPVVLGKNTKAGIRVAHNASVKTVGVTKTTVGKINSVISTVVEKTYEKGVNPAIDAYRRSSQSLPEKPPVPPRHSPVDPNAPIPVAYAPRTSPRPPPPPIPPRLGSPKSGADRAPPPLPPRAPSPLNKQDLTGRRVPLPSETDTLLAADRPPVYTEKVVTEPRPIDTSSTAPSSPASTSSTPRSKRPLLNRMLLAGEVVLTSIEASAHDLINTGTAAASTAAGHRYGPEAGRATALLGGSVRNVAVVYIDVRGVGRKALLKSSAKGFVKARMRNGEVVQLQGEGREGEQGEEVERGEVEVGKGGEVIVGMAEVGGKPSAPSTGMGTGMGQGVNQGYSLEGGNNVQRY